MGLELPLVEDVTIHIFPVEIPLWLCPMYWRMDQLKENFCKNKHYRGLFHYLQFVLTTT